MIVLESFPTQQQLLSEEIEEKMPVFWKNHDFFFFQKEKYSQKSKRSPSVSAPLKTGRSRAGENIDVTSSLFNLFLGKRLKLVLCG
jgi:membrane-bound lytic murein transglycosylase